MKIKLRTFRRTMISMNDNLSAAPLARTPRAHPRRHSMSIRDQSSVSQLPSIESKSSANIICRHVTRHPTAAGPYPRTSIHLGGIPKFSFCLPPSTSAYTMRSISFSFPSPSLPLSVVLSYSICISVSLSFSPALSIARIGTQLGRNEVSADRNRYNSGRIRGAAMSSQ